MKYLNNLIEQDQFYQSLRTASSTIKEMEVLRGIYKKTRKEGTLFGFSVCTEINVYWELLRELMLRQEVVFSWLNFAIEPKYCLKKYTDPFTKFNKNPSYPSRH